MAVVNNLNNTPENQQNSDQNNQQKQQAPQDQFANKPMSVSGSSAAESLNDGNGGFKPGAGQGTSNNSNPTASGRFVNLQSYLNANKDYNSQNGGLAGQLKQNFQNQASQINSGFNQQRQQFQDTANQNRVQYGTDFVNSALTDPYAFTNNQTQGSTNAPTTSNPRVDHGIDMNQYQPTTVNGKATGGTVGNWTNSIDPNSGQSYWVNSGTGESFWDSAQSGTSSNLPASARTNAFQNLLNASYKGPSNFDATDSQYGANQLQANTNLTNSEHGRYALLNQMFTAPSYSSGGKSLDNLFLQGNKDQLAGLQGTRSLSSNLLNNIDSGLAGAQTLAGQYAKEALDTKNQARSALSGAVTGFDTKAKDAVQAAITSRDNQYGLAKTGLTRNEISAENLAKFGLLPDLTLYPTVRPEDYLDKATNTPMVQNIISAPEQNKIASLAKLAGTYMPELNGTLQQYANNDKAGTYDVNATPYSFRTNEFMSALNRASGNYIQDTQNLMHPYVTADNGTSYAAVNNAIKDTGASDPASLIRALQAAAQAKVDQGYPDTPFIGWTQDLVGQLQGLENKYGIDPNTGLSRGSLKTIQPSQSSGTPTNTGPVGAGGGMVRPPRT